MDMLELLEKVGHIATLPAMAFGALAAWKVASIASEIKERVSKIEGHLGL